MSPALVRPAVLVDERLHSSSGEIERLRIDVAEDRPRTDPGNRSGGRKKRERRGDHLIAGADLERHQREQQRIGSGGHADAGGRAAIARDFFLQRPHVLAKNELLARANRFDDLHDFGADLCVLRLKIE